MIYLETQRLIIRSYQPSDWLDLYEMLSDEETVRYEPYKPITVEQAKKELKERILSSKMLAVELKSEHKLIGNLYISASEYQSMELGYVFNRRYWKQNYAYESISALLEVILKKYRIHRVYAQCNPNNENSWHLLERLGFQREAHFKKNIYFFKDDDGNPIWLDTYVYSLLNKNAEQNAQHLFCYRDKTS